MEGKRSLDELLVAFILKELSEEEESVVCQHIHSNEENRQHFEAIYKTWKLVAAKEAFDKIDVNQEWDRFEKTIAAKQQRLIPVKQVEYEAGRDAAEERTGRRPAYGKMLAGMAAAAAILVFMVWGWDALINRNISRPEITRINSREEVQPASVLRSEVNNTGKSRKLVLPDGSQILLFDKSEISYKEPFDANRRDVHLTGKADFKVAKSAARPFTVFSLDLATTALGTHFTISAYPRSSKLTVRLYEGKVVVKSANLVNRTLKYDYYMLPGQDLVYNSKNYTARLINYNAKSLLAKNKNRNEVLPDEDPYVPNHNQGSWYMFNNQNLGQVFDQLEIMYDVRIVYSQRIVRNIYFIGKFNKSDSVNTILSQIAALNGFNVIKNKDTFFIRKSMARNSMKTP